MSARTSAMPLRLLAEILALAAAGQLAGMALAHHLLTHLPTPARMLSAVLLGMVLAAPLVIARTFSVARPSAGPGGTAASSNEPQAAQTRVRLGTAALLTLGVQALGVLLTAFGAHQAERSVQADAQARFERNVDRVATEIQRRLRLPLHGLQGARGTYAASESVNRAEFRAYVESHDFDAAFPYVRGLGFIERVPRGQLDAFIARERADGAPQFKVKSSGAASDLYVIKFIEPLDRNRPALGLDVGDEPRRRAAAERAVDTGEPTMTRPVVLLQDAQRGPGFLLYVPVYRHGSPSRTTEQRRQALTGLLYAPIVARELLEGLTEGLNGEVDVLLHDAEPGQPPELIHETRSARLAASGAPAGALPSFSHTRETWIAGRHWQLQVEATPAFDATIDHHRAQLIVASGAVGSALMGLLVWLLASGRVRAENRARRMTAEVERLARVVRHTTNAVVITDAALRITWVNEAFSRTTGYAPEEVAGREVASLLSAPEDAAHDLQSVLDTLLAGQPVRRELRLHAKDGRLTWQDVDAQPTLDAQGQVAGFMLLGNDISEQRQTRLQLFTALRETQALLGTLHTHAIVSVTDPNGIIIDVNKAFCRISGYRRDELIGQSHRLIASDQHDGAYWRSLWRTVSQGRPWRGLICNRHKDGTPYWVDSMIAPFVGNDGKIEKYVSIRVDVTASVAAREQLARERLRLDNILRGTDVGTWEWNVQTGETTFNEQWARIIGYTLEELSPGSVHTWKQHTHPEDLERSFALLERHFRGEDEHYESEMRMRHRLGHWVWVLARGKVLTHDSAGRPLLMAGTHMDITERKHAEAALRASRAFLDRVSRVAQVGGWELDFATGAVRWSEEVFRLLGRDPDTPLSIDDVVAQLEPQAQQALRTALHEARESGASWDAEWPMRNAQGQRVWARWVGEVQSEASGFARVFGTLQDVTRRRELQDELQRQNEVLATVLESLPCGLSVFDGELRLVAHNAQYRTLLNFPDELFEVANPTYESFIRFNAERGEYGPGDVQALVAERLERARSFNSPTALERERPGGRPLEVRKARMPDGGFVMTFVDITDRRRAEAEVARSAAVLRGAIDTVDEAFVLYDPQDRLLLCNEKYRSLYGTSAPAIVPGATFEEIIRYGAERGQYTEALGRVDEWVAERMARHRAPEHSMVQTLDDGRVLRVIERRMSDGHTVGFRIDITDLVRATRVAEEASQAKTRFLANISHELRTPMNAILGMLRLLGRTPLTPRQADYGHKAEAAARSLLGLLDDVLDFSKIEAGKLVLDPRPFALDRLLRELAVVLAHSVGDKPVDVLFDIDPALPARLVADDMRLRQVLINLCGNAIKFTERGEVWLRLRVQARDGDHVRVACAVSDTGIGIAQEHRARIFSGFTQAEASTTRRFGGTGLGVAISQRLVAMMGGTLELDSELGVGSTFSFSFSAPVDGQDAAAAPAGDAMACLLIDDNAGARQVFEAVAQSLGWTVQCAGDADAALAVAAHQCFDAVFIDAALPGLDGAALSAALRGLGAIDDESLVVALSPRGELPGTSARGWMHNHLSKPYTPAMLLEAVDPARVAALRADLPVLPRHTQTARRLAGLQLLVVEDNLNNQQIACELLGDEGAHVSVAGDGAAAVRMVAEAQPRFDAVLMDLQMPVMDGLTATREIRQRLGLHSLPIIAMTANAMAADREACLAAGMNDHVGKPFDLDALVATVHRHVVHRSPAAAPAATDAATLSNTSDGVDASAALARMGGKRSVYRRALDSLRADLPDTGAQLATLLAGGTDEHRANARRLVHSLRGLAATLGVDGLVGPATLLERQLREAPDAAQDPSLVAAWAQAVQDALPSIDAVLQALGEDAAAAPAWHAAPPSPQQRAALRLHIEELLGLLQASDMRALDVMERTRELAGAQDGAVLQSLAASLAELDFTTGALLCQDWLSQWPPTRPDARATAEPAVG